MRQRLMLTIAGILLVLIGLGLGINAAQTLAARSMELGLIMSDAPITPVEAITCPPQWASGQADSVAVTVFNPLKRTVNYQIDYKYYTDTRITDYSGSDSLSFSIPAQQRQTIALPEFKPSTTALYQFVQLYAYSDDDLANPATFHDWPSSYQGHCGVRLEASSGSRQVKLLSVVGLIMVLAGLGLSLWVSRGSRRKVLTVGAALALMAVVIEMVAVSYVFRPPGV